MVSTDMTTPYFLGKPLDYVTLRRYDNYPTISVWRIEDRTESYRFWRYFGVIEAPHTISGYRILYQLVVMQWPSDNPTAESITSQVIENTISIIDREKL